MVFIRFSGEADFPAAPGTYDAAFNAATSGANSERHYFQEASLRTSSRLSPPCTPRRTRRTRCPSRTRTCAAITNRTTPRRIQTVRAITPKAESARYALLAAALNAVASLVPSGLQLDIDEDGFIDAISFVVRGELTGGDGVSGRTRETSSRQSLTSTASGPSVHPPKRTAVLRRHLLSRDGPLPRCSGPL